MEVSKIPFCIFYNANLHVTSINSLLITFVTFQLPSTTSGNSETIAMCWIEVLEEYSLHSQTAILHSA